MPSPTIRNNAYQTPTPAIATDRTNNPFDTVFDHEEDTEDEWWDEDTTDPGSPSGIDSRHKRQSSGASIPIGLGLITTPVPRRSTRRVDKRYSVQKPIREKSKGRQRKQNARAGIKVVTSFSRHQPAEAPVQLQPSRQVGCFVDLAALQALSGEQVQPSGGFWKSKKSKQASQPNITVPNVSIQGGNLSPSKDKPIFTQRIAGKTMHRVPPPLKLSDDLSPNDRPIFIGISIPSASLAEHATSPRTAVSATTDPARSHERRTLTNQGPETPTIIITPAQECMAWSPLDTQIRTESSGHSQGPSTIDIRTNQQGPPIPTLPASNLEEERQHVTAQRSYFSPDSDDATNWDEEDGPRSRVVSSCTVFEEDESPILTKKGRSGSLSVKPRRNRHASISTVATQRRSMGWWNYITTPFLTRSNTVATRNAEIEQPPALPSLAIAAAKAQDTERDGKKWDKQFSPLTPATSITIASDSWWDIDTKIQKSQDSSPVVQETRHKVQTSSGTLPMIFSDSERADPSGIASQHATPHFPSPEVHSDLVSADSEEPRSAGLAQTRTLESNNPFIQPQLGDLSGSQETAVTRANNPEPARQIPVVVTVSVQIAAPTPPPPYSPSPPRVRYRAILPPGHTNTVEQPLSPGPLSPGLQEAMSSRGDIPMSTVPLTPSPRRPINLNSGYPELPVRQNGGQSISEYALGPSKRAKKVEAKRQRYEKEEAVARKAGGWWRGRGCISNRGCYGRSGAEGRKRRRWYLLLVIGFLTMIILAVVLATTLHRKSNTVIEASQWLNLTGFPPVFLGMSTVAAPVNILTNTGCVFPATQWSCDLPKELQASVAPNDPSQPNFFLYMQWDNSSATNATFANVTGSQNLVTRQLVGNPVSARRFMKRLLRNTRDIVMFVPSPAPPSYTEAVFLGNTTDGIVSSLKAGESTPFYVSFLSHANKTIGKRQVYERDDPSNSSDLFPNITSIIPSPSLNTDGTAAAANLLPFPTQQPVRLYDRGLPTEHYGFYTYYDRSIFLKSLALLNNSNIGNGEVPADQNGGAAESEAAFRCTWAETRFLVQMWTRRNTTARLLNATHTSTSATAATDLTQPGSFPYPITITTDRHGGDPSKKMVYCYALDARAGIITGSGRLNSETRGFGGLVINPAPGFFSNSSDPSLGGFDGGTGGCSCQWSNFQNVIAAGV